MLLLLGFLAGTLIGLLLKRKVRPLLFERWTGLMLLLPTLALVLAPVVLDHFHPELLWTSDRQLLITLSALPILLAMVLILLNFLPSNNQSVNPMPRRWYHRVALLVTAIGLLANALVVLLNRGYMPIPESYLADLSDPVWIEAVRNQALRLKQLIGPETRLPWLGQIWKCDLLRQLGLTDFPYLSLGQIVTAFGLFLIGLTNFWGESDSTES